MCNNRKKNTLIKDIDRITIMTKALGRQCTPKGYECLYQGKVRMNPSFSFALIFEEFWKRFQSFGKEFGKVSTR